MIRKRKEKGIDKIISKRKYLTSISKGKVAIWTRVSSEEQYRSNNSIDTQLTACRRYCEQNNKVIKYEFGGTFESAKKAGERFLEMVGVVLNDAEIDTIVVYDYDRFSRNMEEGLTYKGQLNRSGVDLVAVNQPVDKTNLLASHIEAILLIVADIDNAMRRHKCYEGMVACIHRGEWYSRPPFGYTSNKAKKDHVITINEEGHILKNAWHWIASEPGITQAQILDRLRARGLNINKQRLSACLRNSFYCGRIEHAYLNGKVIKGKQEQMISEVLFDKVQRILNGNNSGYMQATETPRFPLKNHIYYNGHLLSGYTVKAKNIDYYKYSGKDGSVNVSAKELHVKYCEMLDKFKVPNELTPILEEVLKQKFKEKECNQADDISNVKKHLSTINTQIRIVKKNYAIGKIDSEIYNSVIAELETEKQKAEQELYKLSVNLSNLTNYIKDSISIACNLGSYWSKMDFEVCQKVQKMVFPNGVKWDKENRAYLTDGVNEFYDVINRATDIYNKDKIKNEDKSNDLSSLVAGARLELTTFGL